MVRIVFLVLCIVLGLVVVATAFPKKRKLAEMESRLVAAKDYEQTMLEERDYHATEYRALKEDPAFLEIQARDPLNYYAPGERVLKFKR